MLISRIRREIMGNSKRKRVLFLLLIAALFIQTHSLASKTYKVHWLGGPTTIEQDVPSAKQAVDIYCYNGTSKNMFALWQTAQFHIKIQNDKFRRYFRPSPEEVYKEYIGESYQLAQSDINPLQIKIQKTVSISPFAPTCMAVNTKERHTIDLQVLRVDIWRVLLMVSGVILIFLSRALSEHPLIFYLCGIFVGVFGPFIFLVYYVGKLLPRNNRTLTNKILIGGGLVGMLLFEQIWEYWYTHVVSFVSFLVCYSIGIEPPKNHRSRNNITWILEKNLTYPLLVGGWIVGMLLFDQIWEYQTVMFWYILVVSFVSFLVCYSIGIGPPKNHRSRNIVMWILQAEGVLLIFFSSENREASAVVIIAMLVAKYLL